jgi:carbon storage regulator CsrA
MLVLTRKSGEGVNIGRDVEVYVVGVKSGRVKLGFRAPRDVAIQRAEVASGRELTEHDSLPRVPILTRTDGSDFSTSPPLRLFRQPGPV